MLNFPLVLCSVIVILVSGLQYTTAWDSLQISQLLKNSIGGHAQKVSQYYKSAKSKMQVITEICNNKTSQWASSEKSQIDLLEGQLYDMYAEKIENEYSTLNTSSCDIDKHLIEANTKRLYFAIDSCLTVPGKIIDYYKRTIKQNMEPFYRELTLLLRNVDACNNETGFNKNLQCLFKVAKKFVISRNPAIAVDRQIFAAQTYCDLVESHLQKCPHLARKREYEYLFELVLGKAWNCLNDLATTVKTSSIA